MNPISNKSIKIILLIAVSIGIITIILFFISIKVSPVNNFFNFPSNNTSSQISSTEKEKIDAMINEAIEAQLEHPYKVNENLVTKEGDGANIAMNINHWKNVGIETAKISSEEEKKLYLITVESIKAQLEYYSTKKEESLEKAKNLYLPEEFEQYKKYVKIKAEFNEVQNGIKLYEKITTIKFSKPRAYKDLPNRIGVLSNVVYYNNDRIVYLPLIYIYKNIDGEWKIEKQLELDIRPDILEGMLIQKIKEGE